MRQLTVILLLSITGAACGHRQTETVTQDAAPHIGTAITLPTCPDGGETVMRSFAGRLPAEALCTLTVYTQRHSGDGVFAISILDSGNALETTTGRLYTLRGEDDSTIWQCISEDGKQIFYFLADSEADSIFPIRDESDTARCCRLESIR